MKALGVRAVKTNMLVPLAHLTNLVKQLLLTGEARYIRTIHTQYIFRFGGDPHGCHELW